MDEREILAGRFEASRAHLRRVAYRMLGSLSEADDAVQETWLRLTRSDVSGVDNLAGWLTTVVARVCLDVLRARTARREEPGGLQLPEPLVSDGSGHDPEHEALLAGSVGLALLVVLDTLPPSERLAFVLHDLFAVPFEEIARMLDRSPEAARQLASRARRRVRAAPVAPDPDLERQRAVVSAFLAAARGGDLGALVEVLHPDVVLRVELGDRAPGGTRVYRGATDAGEEAIRGARLAAVVRPALVNGAAGLVSYDAAGRPFSVLAFTVRDRRIVEIDVLADPARVGRVAVPTARE